MSEQKKDEYRTVLRCSPELGAWIRDSAKREGRSRNKQIAYCVQRIKELEENAEK